MRWWRRTGFPWLLWSGGDLVYEVATLPENVAERLRRAVEPEGWFDWNVARPTLRGWVRGTEFALSMSLPPPLFPGGVRTGGSFDSVYAGHLVSVPAGCRLVGTLRPRPGVIPLLTLITAGGTSIGVLFGVLTGASGQSPGFPLPSALAALFPMGGLLCLVQGRLHARRGEEALVQRLDALLGAEPRPGHQWSRKPTSLAPLDWDTSTPTLTPLGFVNCIKGWSGSHTIRTPSPSSGWGRSTWWCRDAEPGSEGTVGDLTR